MKLYIANISHSQGNTTFAALSDADRDAQIARWIRDDWAETDNEDAPEGHEAMDDEDVIEAYFEDNISTFLETGDEDLKDADVLAAITGARAVSAAAYLESGVAQAALIVERWASGDLAGAVNGLEEWANDVQAAFPDLDYTDEEAADEEDA